MIERLIEVRSMQLAQERRRLDDAAALVLQANQVVVDLVDHRRPAEILSSLIEKGFSPAIGPENPRRP